MDVKKYLCFGVCCASAMMAAAPSVAAQESSHILDIRLRGEYVEQDGRTDAEALTLRVRAGYDYAISDRWRLLGEGEGVLHLTDNFADTVENRPGYAVVADPEALELNRLQLSYKDKQTAATLGRQRIILDNARFVGNVGFRQNEQTFDAVRASHKFSDAFSAEYVYIDKVHRIFGDDSPVGDWDSESHVLRAGVKTDFGKFQGYGLLLDFDNAAGASGQTWGASWAKGFNTEFGKLNLRAEGAIQSEYKGKGPSSDVGYRAASAALTHGKITASLGVEVLEGSGGRGFITPLATLHKFQGWADAFLATPAIGVRDIQGGIKGSFSNFVEDAKPISWGLYYHDFATDNGRNSLGSEIDAVMKIPVSSKISVETKLAVFNGDAAGPADRTKFWFALSAGF